MVGYSVIEQITLSFASIPGLRDKFSNDYLSTVDPQDPDALLTVLLAVKGDPVPQNLTTATQHSQEIPCQRIRVLEGQVVDEKGEFVVAGREVQLGALVPDCQLGIRVPGAAESVPVLDVDAVFLPFSSSTETFPQFPEIQTQPFSTKHLCELTSHELH